MKLSTVTNQYVYDFGKAAPEKMPNATTALPAAPWLVSKSVTFMQKESTQIAASKDQIAPKEVLKSKLMKETVTGKTA